MNASKLAKQLQKELTRNPKKTAVLGLVTLVAIWFWGPLIWKYTAGGKKAKAKPKQAAAATAVAGASTPAAAPVSEAKPAAPRINWEQLLEQIAQDPRMQTATTPRGQRDPFSLTAAELLAQQQQQQAERDAAAALPVAGATAPVRAVPVTDPTPDSLGLVLQGTLVSHTSRKATISGRTYRPGDVVRIAPAAGAENTTAPTIEFTVEQIERRRVVLERNDKQYELALVKESLAEGDELTFHPSRP